MALAPTDGTGLAWSFGVIAEWLAFGAIWLLLLVGLWDMTVQRLHRRPR